MLFPDYMQKRSGAVFSPCEKYRYRLWRIWDETKPILGGLLLNPSTATAEEDDPTVYRMGQRARRNRFGGLVICNIFAYRSTDPDALYTLADPVGPDNDAAIMEEAKRVSLWICGWGKHGALNQRGYQVYRMLYNTGKQPFALSVNKDGSPEHPLYLPYSLQPQPYTPEEIIRCAS
jgi:hypothetical protein